MFLLQNCLHAVKAECLKASQSLDSDDILVLPLDVTDIDPQERCLDTAIKHFGYIDVLVNHASRTERGTFEEINLKMDRELFELDVFSVANLTHLYMMHSKGEGHVVVTSTLFELHRKHGVTSHTAAKQAIRVSIGYVYNLCIQHISLQFEFQLYI